MSNQASEDELNSVLSQLMKDAITNRRADDPPQGREMLLGNAKAAIHSLIRTEKLKLLAAVREQSQEYELNMHGFYDKDISDRVTAVDLEVLTKLEAEL